MKGQAFTVAAFLMTLSLLAFAMIFANASLSSSGDVSLLSSVDKIDYVFNSIRMEAHQASGLSIYKSDKNITINDTIPRSTSFRTQLAKYEDFIEDEFESQAINITFLNSAGGAIDWNSISNLTITPMNMSYRYPLSGEELLEVRSQGSSGLDRLERMDITLRSSASIVQGSWDPEALCSPAGSPPQCLPARITVYDGISTWDSGEKNFNLSSESVIQHTAGTGFIRIKIGGGNKLLGIETDAIDMNSSIKLALDTTDFDYSMTPARLRVADALVSREAEI